MPRMINNTQYPMKTGKNTVVTLTYTLRMDNHEGELVEVVEKSSPAVFLLGVGNLLEKFEQNLDGLGAGETFAFGLTSEEGYGSIEEEAVVDIPLTAFEVDGQVDMEMLEPGSILPMRDMDGNLMRGKITAVDQEYVTMDFNHPLAGKNLHFSGEILEVRAASEEELSHGHVHGEGGHHH